MIQVMANCFENSTFTPSRNGSCPTDVGQFYVGFQWENGQRDFELPCQRTVPLGAPLLQPKPTQPHRRPELCQYGVSFLFHFIYLFMGGLR